MSSHQENPSVFMNAVTWKFYTLDNQIF